MARLKKNASKPKRTGKANRRAAPKRVEEPKRKVRFGGLKGKFKVPDDFDDPLTDEVLESIE
jgi:hypothetical protein